MSDAKPEVKRKFKPGDVVKLRTGGPAMNVNGYSLNGEVSCVWFRDVHSEPFWKSFSQDVLEKYERDPTPSKADV